MKQDKFEQGPTSTYVAITSGTMLTHTEKRLASGDVAH